jgi:two-component system chemotaxis sensor kinase CheA
MVGELVITQAMLNELGEAEEFDQSKLAALQEGLAQLSHNTRDLQESVMRIRMLPISFVFSRFPRLVRDISQKLDKQVELKLIGEQTELDKTVMEKISDPMVHLIRNSLDHGLETPEDRLQAGKDPTGSVTLNAYHQGGNIVIEIIDDGRGLNTAKIKEKALANGLIAETDDLSDDEINELIFRPGFSTADAVSDLSGRGVGMDVVKRNINELNGTVEVASTPNVGSTFTIRLPLTLAILDGQLITVGSNVYIIPLVSIVESLQIDISKVNSVGGGLDVLRLRDEYIPIMRLHDLFNHSDAQTRLEDGLLVVVESDNEKVGLLVDDLMAQQQFVIKSLEANYKKVDGISGATILGDGSVSLIVDISGLIKLAGLKKAGRQGLEFNKPLSEAV